VNKNWAISSAVPVISWFSIRKAIPYIRYSAKYLDLTEDGLVLNFITAVLIFSSSGSTLSCILPCSKRTIFTVESSSPTVIFSKISRKFHLWMMPQKMRWQWLLPTKIVQKINTIQTEFKNNRVVMITVAIIHVPKHVKDIANKKPEQGLNWFEVCAGRENKLLALNTIQRIIERIFHDKNWMLWNKKRKGYHDSNYLFPL
jgi:hypothetical protein